MTPAAAMIFAAGRGERMMPLTASRPKPMIEVLGKPLLGHALERVKTAGINSIVVNTHYCAEVVKNYLPPETAISHETELLDTGGGVKKALQEKLLPETAPFLAVNSDVLWTDGDMGAIERLGAAWTDNMDVLLLLVPKDRAWGHEGNKGDYAMNAEGRLMRLSNPDAPYIYAGVQIVRPQMYADPALGARFSNLKIFDAAEAKGRLFGLVHDGGWFHFSTPQSLALFQSRQKP